MTAMFLLPPPPESWDGPSEVVASMSDWPFQRTIEPAGRGFLTLLKKLSGEYHEEDNEDDDDAEKKDDDADADLRRRSSHKHKLHPLEQNTEDLYALLGLGHLRWRATNDDLKAAYRKMILIYHPDKMKASEVDVTDESDERFKAIQKAYDTLTDLKKRRAYDSTEDFDDAIPSESAARKATDFYKLFDSVFERNAQWSLVQPAPKLGDDSTSFDDTKKFYNFWWDFKSWRDFKIEDEFDLEQAESREEKRWMELQNEKQKASKKKEERTRILRLAELAYKFDPRIRRQAEEAEAAKNKKKNAAAEAKRKAQEEAERKIEEEKRKKEEDDKKASEDAAVRKKQKVQEQKRLTRLRKEFRNTCKLLEPVPRDEEVELLIIKFNAAQLGELLGSIKGEAQSQPAAEGADEEESSSPSSSSATLNKQPFDAAISQFSNELTPPPRHKVEPVKVVPKEKPWTDDELSNLAKGLIKYPGGVSNRWEQIADLLPGRTTKEIANKVKEVKSAQQYANKSSVMTSKDPFDKLKSKVGEKPISAVPSQRTDENQPWEEAAPATTTTTDAAPAATTTAAETEEVEWTPEEQKALEAGIQKYKNGTPDRWDKVADHVKTKSKKECVARYKYLVTLYKGKK